MAIINPSPDREWFAVDTLTGSTDHPAMHDETAWLPPLDSHWETVGGLVVTITDHAQHDTSLALQITIENQHQRQTRFSRIHFADAVERGLFTRIEQGSEAGDRPLSPQASERQVAIRRLCHQLNEHGAVSCARIEDYDHHILLVFDVERIDESATVPDEIHTLLTDTQFVPLFETAADETLTGSLAGSRDGWDHHRYVAVDETTSSTAPTHEMPETVPLIGRIDLELDAGAIIGAYTGLPAPDNPSLPLVTGFDIPPEHEQALREALAQCDVAGHEVDLTIRLRRITHRHSVGRYLEVVLTPVFNVTSLCDTITEHISDLDGTVYLRGDEMERIDDGSLTYAIRLGSGPSSRSQPFARLVEWVMTALPEPVKATAQRWRPGTTFTADVTDIRLQIDGDK
jgi:hypothetical protein